MHPHLLNFQDQAGSKQFVPDFLIPNVLQRYGIAPRNFIGAIVLEAIMNFEKQPNSQSLPDGVEKVRDGRAVSCRPYCIVNRND